MRKFPLKGIFPVIFSALVIIPIAAAEKAAPVKLSARKNVNGKTVAVAEILHALTVDSDCDVIRTESRKSIQKQEFTIITYRAEFHQRVIELSLTRLPAALKAGIDPNTYLPRLITRLLKSDQKMEWKKQTTAEGVALVHLSPNKHFHYRRLFFAESYWVQFSVHGLNTRKKLAECSAFNKILKPDKSHVDEER